MGLKYHKLDLESKSYAKTVIKNGCAWIYELRLMKFKGFGVRREPRLD